MISNEDKHTITDLAKRYNVSKIYLLGSTLSSEKEPNDIDLAVEGLADSLFFKFYGDLILFLSKPVDLVDLKIENSFTRMIRNEGIVIYA